MRRYLWIVAIIIALSSFAFGQRTYELACPAGSTDLQGPAFNPSSHSFRSWLCIDPSGNITYVGASQFSSVNGTFFFASKCPGADIGAQINACYAALPSQGGTIVVEPKSDGTCYSYTTPILLNTTGKIAYLVGSADATCLSYTPTSGSAITLGWGSGGQGVSSDGNFNGGIDHIKLLGACATNACAGVTSVGLQMGTGTLASTGIVGAYFSNMQIGSFNAGNSFAIGINFPTQWAFGDTFQNVHIYNNNVGINQPAAQGNERLLFNNSFIARNATGATLGGTLDFTFTGDSFDDNTVALAISGNLQVTLRDCHFEDAQSDAFPAQYITNTSSGGAVLVYGGQMIDDHTSGTNPQFITMSGANLIVDGTLIFSSGITVTQAVNITAGSSYLHFVNLSPTLITVTTNTANRFIDATIRSDIAMPVIRTSFFANAYVEQTSVPTAAAGQDICYGDATDHVIKCSMNNESFGEQPLDWDDSGGGVQTGSIAATTIFTPVANKRVLFSASLTQIGAGVGCTTNTTIVANAIWTDPAAAGATTAAAFTFTITNNGTANTPVLPGATGGEVLYAKGGTNVQYSTTFTGGTCTTTPTYQIQPSALAW